jgi:capsular exopolysaccharide synthesis family protein
MSNEIQLSNTSLPLQPALTPPQVLAPAGQPEPTPLRRIHRLLRGRYGLAVVLATIGAACGVAAGILLPKPAWESIGVVEMKPITYGTVEDKPKPLYDRLVQDVIVTLHTERVIKHAMQNPAWKQLRPCAGDYPPADQIAQFTKNLQVRSMPFAPQMIQVSYIDTAKDGKDVAQVAVRSVIDAYQELWETRDSQELARRIQLVQDDISKEQNAIDADRKLIAQQTKEIGDDANAMPLLISRQERLLALQQQLKVYEHNLELARRDTSNRKTGLPVANATPDEIARVDVGMANRLQALTNAQAQLQAMRSTGQFGPNFPQIRQAQTMVDICQKQVDDYAANFNAKYFIQTRADGSGISMVPKDTSTMEEAIRLLKNDIEQATKEVDGINGRHAAIVQLNADIDRHQQRINRDNSDLSQLQFQQQMGGQFSVVDDGSTPQPASDRRPVFAALGFVGGAAVPIGFLLLLGLANPRYRFSDETNTETIGLNLLGILPDLPDRLSDPEQASIAAHCVHQIRTMLQISGGSEERRVFAVTSAAPGDGKTSLTLALGLSYAACGTRTLLIDCDLVGAGLTSRMNVNSPEGVLEAIANRSLLEYVRHTEVADVSILPVGSAQTLHASTLSPAALRRLIDEARKQFDTILIDTGPILGSIEASLVCAAADAVVLTVARGQQRPLVEKSISHLMNIGAKLAGVVFNRAQSNDFDRSISGVSSLRSVSAGTGHNNGNNGPRYGTLGRAVHSSNRQSDINEG